MSESELHHAQQLHKAGQLVEAEEIYRKLLAGDPSDAMTTFLLGQLLQQRGQLPEAIEKLKEAIRLQPQFPEAHHQLAVAYQAARNLPAAFESFREALQQRPRYALAYNSLGLAHQAAGDYLKAIEAYRSALAIQGDLHWAMTNLGSLLSAQGRDAEAIEMLQRAIKIEPKHSGAHNNLGAALRQAGRLDEAIAEFSEALRLRPEFAPAYNNLGRSLMDAGQTELALGYFRRTVELQPNVPSWHSNLIASMSYVSLESRENLKREMQIWNQRHAAPLMPKDIHFENSRQPQRRLRIGYVSPDFMGHPIGRFMLPLLANHDRENYEVFCYSDVHWPDETTKKLQGLADHWRDGRGKTDVEVAEVARRDQIDILVDLTLHAAGNRLLAFAQRPAPVQVTYLAYCGSSGLSAIDYRLTDPHLDPPGCDESSYSEKSVRLARTYWCYATHFEDGPAIHPLPAARDGVVTFASFNNFCKLSKEGWELWRRVLGGVPRSRLVLHAPFGSHRDRLRHDLATDGVNPDRLSFVPQVSTREYFQNYQQVDIALDTIPFNGGTTTCDALWMGVPVIALRGLTGVGRAGVSILTNVGLPELIANTPDEFVAVAKKLAGDLPRLAELRRTLREQMKGSPLMDAPQFAGDVEIAFREMWSDWCRKESP
jgi:protein O-GlcNAc transferase